MPRLETIHKNHGRSKNDIFTLFTGSTEVFVQSEIPVSPLVSPKRYPRVNLDAPEADPRDPLILQWLTPEQPYMALIPRQDPFRGFLFSRLRYHFSSLPIVRVVGRRSPVWQLEPSVIQEWQALEIFCRQAVMGLFNLCHGSHLPQRFELWRFPERYKYSHEFTMEQDARVAAFRA